VVMMPEARMYLDEELIPFAESELLLAMDDVKRHYNIDEDRIYLHANCSGGYRALQMAAKHPDLFAAVGLYAPLYERGMSNLWSEANAPRSLIGNLKGMPMMIYGDPVDPHSPCGFYKGLVADCDRHDIPLTFELKRNAGLSYNIVVLGKEACAFFRDKSLNGRKPVEVKIPNAEKVMADFYAKPFMYVYSAADTTRAYHAMVDSIRSEYENYLFSALPLVPDTIVTKKMLAEKNVCFIGDKFSNVILDDYMEYIRGHQISKRDLIAVYQHPRNKNGFIMEYNTNLPIRFRHLYPWRRYVKRLVATKMNK
ncbi:MAG: hypothetical protein IJR86_01260, partial [Bacteroidaceae bacterium]|nr:hypothetical protein [Bacteroidaceae bacterium]